MRRRRTVIVNGPLALRMRRLAAARAAETGLYPSSPRSPPGGRLYRPATPEQLMPAIGAALTQGGFAKLGPMCELPGIHRALLATLGNAVLNRM